MRICLVGYALHGASVNHVTVNARCRGYPDCRNSTLFSCFWNYSDFSERAEKKQPWYEFWHSRPFVRSARGHHGPNLFQTAV